MPPKDLDHEDFASNDHSDYVVGDTHYPLCEDIPYTDGKSMIMSHTLWRWIGNYLNLLENVFFII